MMRLSRRVVLYGRPRHLILGIEVVDLFSSRDETRIDALRMALLQLESNHPEFLEQFRRDVRRIVLLAVGPRYWIRERTCVLPDPNRLSTTRLAMTIVHEGTHARQAASGQQFNYETLGAQEVECVGAEVDYASRIAGAEEDVEWAVSKLERPWWTADQKLGRYLSDLEQLQAPDWVLRIAERRVSRARQRNSDDGG